MGFFSLEVMNMELNCFLNVKSLLIYWIKYMSFIFGKLVVFYGLIKFE